MLYWYVRCGHACGESPPGAPRGRAGYVALAFLPESASSARLRLVNAKILTSMFS